MEKVYSDPHLGDVLFRKRKGIRRMSIRVHPVKGVSVSVPYLIPFSVARAFLMAKREWVLQAVDRQKERYKDHPMVDASQIESMRQQAKLILPLRLKELADRYGFRYNRVTIKHNSTNWGSCSAKGNINLNLNVVRLPAPLADYILLHELCHLIHHNHGHEFHLLLEKVCADNLMSACDRGDNLALEFAKEVAETNVRYPHAHIFSKALRNENLILPLTRLKKQ